MFNGRMALTLSLLAACGMDGEVAAAGESGEMSDTETSSEVGSSSTGEPPCEPGSTEPCQCEDNPPSLRTCLESGEFDACECPACGDGNVDEGEACDDGNLDAGDGCDAECGYESGTVLFDIDVGRAPRALIMTSDDRIGAYAGTRVAVYDLEGKRAWRSVWPEALSDLPESLNTRNSIVALHEGGVLFAASDCSFQWTKCDVWGHYDRDGTLIWEHVFGEVGEVEMRIVRPSSSGGFLVSGGLRETEGEPLIPVIRHYAADRELDWEVRTARIAQDFVSAPDGDAAVFIATADGSNTIRAIDTETGSLAPAVGLAEDWSGGHALGREGVIYSYGSWPSETLLLLRKMSASGEELWATDLPLFPFGVLELGHGEVLVFGFSSEDGDTVLVLDVEGNIVRTHDFDGGAHTAVLGPNNFVIGAVGSDRLVRFVP